MSGSKCWISRDFIAIVMNIAAVLHGPFSDVWARIGHCSAMG